MSRIVKNDFKEILKYIEDFNLKKLLSQQGYSDVLSTYHKKYYSFFILAVELEMNMPLNDYLFLKESNSDLITCLFHLSTGNYKSSKLLLRSSIECYIKAFSLSWIPDIDKEKSVYKIFDQVKALPYFSSEPFKSQIENIHNSYKLLCKDVHTADSVNMANINSLDFFPKYSKTNSSQINKIALNLIPSFCLLLSTKYNESFHKIHHNHKELILDSIVREFRPIVMNTNK